MTKEVVADVDADAVGTPAAFSNASCWLIATDVREDSPTRYVPIAPGCMITTPATRACPIPYTGRLLVSVRHFPAVLSRCVRRGIRHGEHRRIKRGLPGIIRSVARRRR